MSGDRMTRDNARFSRSGKLLGLVPVSHKVTTTNLVCVFRMDAFPEDFHHIFAEMMKLMGGDT